MSIFNIVANDGRHDYMFSPDISNWDLEVEDMIKLETWPIERDISMTLLDVHTRLPKVICSIISEYTGSAYFDALFSLGQSQSLKNYIRSCKSRDKLSLNSAQSIMNLLAKTISMPVPKKYPRAIIRDTISNFNKLDSYPSRIGDLKRCAVFHQLLLTYF